jgi:hypothetical protein
VPSTGNPVEDIGSGSDGEDGEAVPATFETALVSLFSSLDLSDSHPAGTFHIHTTPIRTSPVSLNTEGPLPTEPEVLVTEDAAQDEDVCPDPEEVIGSVEWTRKGALDAATMRRQIKDLYATACQTQGTKQRTAHTPQLNTEHQMHCRDFPTLRHAAAKLTVLSKSKKIDVVFRACLAAMHAMLNLFLNPCFDFSWRTCLSISARSQGFKGELQARSVRTWIHNYIHFNHLPYHGYMGNITSMLNDEEFSQGLQMFLLETVKGRPIHADNVVAYVALEEVQRNFGRIKIHVHTGAVWLRKLGWQYGLMKNGMFNNGHERIDVIQTRNKLTKRWFIKYRPQMTMYNNNGKIISLPNPSQLELILVTHNESIFHAQDR